MIEYKVRVYDTGDKYWWSNGKLHREDGPAVEFTNGDKYWFLNDKRHREDGPAMVRPNGNNSWWINGKRLTEKAFNNRHNVELTLEEISEKFNIPLDKLRIKK